MYHLAQLNIARLHHPLDSAQTAEFVAALGPINAIAEATPGFVWRLTDESGASSSYVELPGNEDPLVIINLSVWEDLESLRHFMYKSGHAAYLRRRREWFAPATEATTVLWWLTTGEIPSVGDAYARLLKLRAEGPSADGWPLTKPMPPPTP